MNPEQIKISAMENKEIEESLFKALETSYKYGCDNLSNQLEEIYNAFVAYWVGRYMVQLEALSDAERAEVEKYCEF